MIKIEHHRCWSGELRQHMELLCYGHAGRPILIFPTVAGRYTEFAGNGMVDACREFLEAGRVRFITVDSILEQTWLNAAAPRADRAARHQEYLLYIVEEVVPFIQDLCKCGKLAAGGCSFGGFYAMNGFLHYPDLFDAVISLSGFFQLEHYLGDGLDDGVYHAVPLAYLPDLNHPWYLDQYRQARLLLSVGQHPSEARFLADSLALKGVFDRKKIPAELEVLGREQAHDWPWWRRQFPTLLERLLRVETTKKNAGLAPVAEPAAQ